MRNKLRKAIGLKYEEKKDTAPRLIAKGKGSIAEKIIELAKKNGVPVKNDPDLVEVLSKLEINEEIPPDLYIIVAELLAFVYRMNSKARQN